MLTEATAATTIKNILERPPALTAQAAAALPTPAAPAFQPAYFPPAPQQPVPPALGPAPGYAPTPPPYWPSVPPILPSPARGGRSSASGSRPFLGKPVSGLIIGNSIALASLGPGRPCTCAIASAYPGRLHRPFKCPISTSTWVSARVGPLQASKSLRAGLRKTLPPHVGRTGQPLPRPSLPLMRPPVSTWFSDCLPRPRHLPPLSPRPACCPPPWKCTLTDMTLVSHQRLSSLKMLPRGSCVACLRRAPLRRTLREAVTTALRPKRAHR